MLNVTRYDVGTLRAPKRMADGRLRVDGHLTRAGVFAYRNPDGTQRLEYRPPAEVFHADSLASFAMVAVTDNHPQRLVDTTTARQVAVGWTGEGIRQDGNLVAGTLMIADAATIAKVEAGKQSLSCGYTCDVDETPGTTPGGEKYDAIQKNIRGNHVAIVDVGRAGPDAKLRLDSDGVQVHDDGDKRTHKEQPKMVKIKVDGVEVEVSEMAAQVIARADAKREADLAAAKAEGDKQRGRADAAELELTKERKARTDAEDPARIAKAVGARVKLEESARRVLGSAEKFDGKSDREIKVAVVKKGDAKFDDAGASEGYIDGRFDAAIASAPTALDAASVITPTGRGDGATTDIDGARARMLERNKKAHLTAGETEAK